MRLLRKIATRLKNRERGFTLVEMMAVTGILSVLSAVAFPAVVGTASVGKSTTQTVDITGVQRSFDHFKSGPGADYATFASLPGTVATWADGQLPTEPITTGDGKSLSTAMVFTQENIAGIDWSASNDIDGETTYFVGDYIRITPDHFDDVFTVGPGANSPVFRIKRLGQDFYVQLENTAATSIDFLRWGADYKGLVWVFVDQETY